MRPRRARLAHLGDVALGLRLGHALGDRLGECLGRRPSRRAARSAPRRAGPCRPRSSRSSRGRASSSRVRTSNAASITALHGTPSPGSRSKISRSGCSSCATRRAPGMDLQHARLHQLDQAVETVEDQHRVLLADVDAPQRVPRPCPGMLGEEALLARPRRGSAPGSARAPSCAAGSSRRCRCRTRRGPAW